MDSPGAKFDAQRRGAGAENRTRIACVTPHVAGNFF
jgi:hypothetical protein